MARLSFRMRYLRRTPLASGPPRLIVRVDLKLHTTSSSFVIIWNRFTGTRARLLPRCPTTLFARHGKNTSRHIVKFQERNLNCDDLRLGYRGRGCSLDLDVCGTGLLLRDLLTGRSGSRILERDLWIRLPRGCV